MIRTHHIIAIILYFAAIAAAVWAASAVMNTASAAQLTEQEVQTCTALSKIAGNIMTAHQNGVSYADALNWAVSQDVSTRTRVVLLELVRSIYQLPVGDTLEARKGWVEMAKKLVFKGCLKGVATPTATKPVF